MAPKPTPTMVKEYPPEGKTAEVGYKEERPTIPRLFPLRGPLNPKLWGLVPSRRTPSARNEVDVTLEALTTTGARVREALGRYGS